MTTASSEVLHQTAVINQLWRQFFGAERGLVQIFTGIRDESGDLQNIKQAPFNYPSAAKAAAEWALEMAKEEGREVYYCAHLLDAPERKKENAHYVHTLYGEKDSGPIPNGNLKPTNVVESSPSHYHLGFRLNTSIPPERAERLNKRIAKYIGADWSGADLTQLLRVPGTPNNKYPDKPIVRLVEINAEREYTEAELDAILPPLEEARERSDSEPDPDDEPPVVLSPQARRVWNGEEPKYKEEFPGEIDKSATLMKIARVLFEASANRRVIVRDLRERDETLGYNKYTTRRDDREYHRIVDKLEKEGRGGGRITGTQKVEVKQGSGSGDPFDGIFTADELWDKEFAPPKWAVHDLLPEGVCILAGRPKLGKSWAAYHLSIAVAAGGTVLSKYQVDQGNSLYMALEDGERRLQKRLKKLIPVGRPPKDLELVTAWPRLDEGGTDCILQWLETRENPRLIVIDTLKKVRPQGKGKNLYAEDYEALEPLLPIARDHSVAILVVHHVRKMEADDPLDMVSGTIGLTGGVDGAMVLKRERGRADAFLHVSHRDLEDDLELALGWDQLTATWHSKGDAEEFRLTQERAAVIEVLKDVPEGMGPKAIQEALEAEGKQVSYGSIRLLVMRMAKDGQLENPRQGIYRVPHNIGVVSYADEDSEVF